ncbi:MAG TPA: tRNA pseudouridine(55) synthase TruB [Fibrobacteraceae bacterium]|nr:tRNA pseudouridine(55) synthase TruB [Fibrobacteraceae bacterium]
MIPQTDIAPSRGGQKIEPSGFVLVDKPAGLTSFQVLSPLKRLFQTRRIGHAGTLDQEATGLIIAAVGKATRLLSHIESANKTYVFRLHLGRETDSLEFNGKILREAPLAARSSKDLEDILPQFLGQQKQIPPTFSAIKIAGHRASDLARKGQEVSLHPRQIEVFHLALQTLPPKTEFRTDFDLSCHCTKGTYIRALGRDLAKALGTIGCVSQIRRTAIGKIMVQEALAPEEIQPSHLFPPEALLSWPQMEISTSHLANLRQGKRLAFPTEFCPTRGPVFAMHEGVARTACHWDGVWLSPEIQLG